MKAIIEVRMDNAAFEENQGGELSRILRALADTIDDLSALSSHDNTRLMDRNGNHVGDLIIDEKD